MAYVQNSSKTTVTENNIACVVKFDDDLPNGPFAEGSCGNAFQPGSFTVSVPSSGATWGMVAQLVVNLTQAEMDKFSNGGEMKDMGGGHRVGHVIQCVPVHVKYKGGPTSAADSAKEGSCTVVVSVHDSRTTDVCCIIL